MSPEFLCCIFIFIPFDVFCDFPCNFLWAMDCLEVYCLVSERIKIFQLFYFVINFLFDFIGSRYNEWFSTETRTFCILLYDTELQQISDTTGSSGSPWCLCWCRPAWDHQQCLVIALLVVSVHIIRRRWPRYPCVMVNVLGPLGFLWHHPSGECGCLTITGWGCCESGFPTWSSLTMQSARVGAVLIKIINSIEGENKGGIVEKHTVL